jgi:hypothetical protein
VKKKEEKRKEKKRKTRRADGAAPKKDKSHKLGVRHHAQLGSNKVRLP